MGTTKIIARTIKIPANQPTPIRIESDPGAMELIYLSTNTAGPQGNLTITIKNNGNEPITILHKKNGSPCGFAHIENGETFLLSTIEGCEHILQFISFFEDIKIEFTTITNRVDFCLSYHPDTVRLDRDFPDCIKLKTKKIIKQVKVSKKK